MFTSYCCFFCSACYLHVCLKYIFSAYDQIAPTRCRSCPHTRGRLVTLTSIFSIDQPVPKIVLFKRLIFYRPDMYNCEDTLLFFARPLLAKLWSITKRIPFLPRSPLPYLSHDDVMTWKRFPYSWPFERGIHRLQRNSLHKRSSTRAVDVFFGVRQWKLV